jgi:uncharacterized protein YyaL (SSP411 family)
MSREEKRIKGRNNRLIREKSPYLLQHAENPVDWYPWGEEAFAKARAEDKPIFLSIGYSTCHWCHVMERESFMDPEVAKLMNGAFVCIKVDREERPDVDVVYMAACQMVTGSGGWPLTAIMTPDKKPFFIATYIPKESRPGSLGMLDLIPRIRDLWAGERRDLLQAAYQIADALVKSPAPPSGTTLGEDLLKRGFEHLAATFDAECGGFGGRPKFPSPHNLIFLLRHWHRYKEPRALEMVEKTLQAMRQGGIYDHLGFGFHRYSTDREWLLPHFEKMLYDQAMLTMAYLEAYQATGNASYERVAREILAYVLFEMTAPEGGFYSAEDAESEGVEGKYYVWTEEEIRRVLGEKDAAAVISLFGIQKEGNFTDEATRRKTGLNILHLGRPLAEAGLDLHMTEEAVEERLEVARQKLLEAREGRIRPQKDDKILTDWNGLMIAALAKAAQAFDHLEYARSAQRAADFILQHLRGKDGPLLHRYRRGEAGIVATLDDYAFLIWGLIELYEATFQVRYLQAAIGLNKGLLERFWDDQEGGFYFSPVDGERLLVRSKEAYDGAIPSGNSVAMLNLLRLGKICADPKLEGYARRLGRTFSGAIKQVPGAHAFLLVALDFAIGPSYEVIVAGSPQAEDTKKMVQSLRLRFLPNKVVLLVSSPDEDKIAKIAPYAKGISAIEGKATAYVCSHYRCNAPTTDINVMLKLLHSEPANP